MKGKLIKRGEGDYKLFVNDTPFGQSKESPYNKLSLKNCEAIANGYDLDELGRDLWKKSLNYHLQHELDYTFGVVDGFQKALELLGDKKFSEDDVKLAIEYGIQSVLQAVPGVTSAQSVLDSYKQSLQQTEWDVEILMGTNYRDIDCVNEGNLVASKIVKDNEAPMLDKDGCLILKRL